MLPEKEAEVRAWLSKARNDLRAAGVDLEANPPLLEDVVFHSQQAVEKALKGFLVAHDIPFRKTHDLDELSAACEAIDASLKPALDPARDLTPYAWVFRYPGDSAEPSLDDAKQAVARATVAVDALAETIGIR